MTLHMRCQLNTVWLSTYRSKLKEVRSVYLTLTLKYWIPQTLESQSQIRNSPPLCGLSGTPNEWMSSSYLHNEFRKGLLTKSLNVSERVKLSANQSIKGSRVTQHLGWISPKPLDAESISTIHLDVLTRGACGPQRHGSPGPLRPQCQSAASLRSLRMPHAFHHTSSSPIQSIELLLNKSANGRRRRRRIDTFRLQMGFELESNEGLYWHIAFLWHFTSALIECLCILHVSTCDHGISQYCCSRGVCVLDVGNMFSKRTIQQRLSPENWKGQQLEAKGQSILDMYKMSSSDGLKAYDTVSDTQRCCKIPCKKVRQSFFMVLHLFVLTKSDRWTCV